MRRLFENLVHFAKDERGVFAALFGIMSIVLIATAGAVVDFVGVQKARNSAQLALDAATLALQPEIFELSDDQIKTAALGLIIERLADTAITVDMETISTDTTAGSLFLEARLTIPTAFVALVAIPTMSVRVASQATRKKLAVEVAMVLDNSGSMASSSRMTNLKAAASNATEILFSGLSTQPNVFIGIVPFTFFVNIGAGNAGASWIDAAGNSSIANDNFDNDNDDSTPFNGPVNRLALYSQLSNVSWGGCVVARPNTSTGPGSNLDTDDTTPDISIPDTLFVPAFAPDTPDSWDTWLNDYIDDDDAAACSSISGGSDRERQERLCKYSGSINTSTYGPNMDCPSAPTLPLTNVKQPVLDAIDDMVASGGTNIHMGAVWGFRLLSPTVPFTEGDVYDEATAKVIIMMTDGENTTYGSGNMNGASFYTAYGYPFNNRLGTTSWSEAALRAEMDARTVESCANAKAEGIVIYTIGLNPPNTATQTMLETCATSLAHAFFPTQPSELDAVFTGIANQLAALRLSQ
ncbi:MAG: hypothetical protein GXP01_11025 [Alphaproteobacteria bacterium]|nr:hypothetical protein [Alphaproteobacteria bacterium]